jgi:hypothetical protein
LVKPSDANDIGDLLKQSLAEIWDNDLFAVLSDRNRLSGHCRVCD